LEKWIIARHDSKEENISIEMFSGSKAEIVNLLKEKSESDINADHDAYQKAYIYEDAEAIFRAVLDFNGYNIMYQAIETSVL